MSLLSSWALCWFIIWFYHLFRISEWVTVLSSTDFTGKKLRQCLDVIHRDIVSVWNIRNSSVGPLPKQARRRFDEINKSFGSTVLLQYLSRVVEVITKISPFWDASINNDTLTNRRP